MRFFSTLVGKADPKGQARCSFPLGHYITSLTRPHSCLDLGTLAWCLNGATYRIRTDDPQFTKLML